MSDTEDGGRAGGGSSEPSRKLSICIFQNKELTRPAQKADVSWSEVRLLLQAHKVRRAKPGPMLGAYALEGTRSNENVKHRSLLQIDIDTKVDEDENGRVTRVTKAAPALEEIRDKIDDYEWVASSSWSHDPKLNLNNYRIVFLTDRDIYRFEYEAVLEAVDELLNRATDRAAWNWSQAFYLPSCPEEHLSSAFAEHNLGRPLPVDKLVERGREIIEARNKLVKKISSYSEKKLAETDKNIAHVRSLLWQIPANIERNLWRNMLWAIADLDWKSGKDLAKEWSKSAPEKYDEAEFERVWNSYDPDREGRIRFRSLVRTSRQYEAVKVLEAEGASGSVRDIQNGRRFAEKFIGKLVHIHETGDWLHFDARVGWVSAPPGEAERAAKSIVDELIDELALLMKGDL